MANMLDEKNGPVNQNGQDVNVIDKQIAPETGAGSIIFEVILWCLAIIPGLIFLIKKIQARNYFDGLQQKIQGAASEIDNELEQRVQILKNASQLVNKAAKLDKDTMMGVAGLRSGNIQGMSDASRNELAGKLDSLSRNIAIAVEDYPDLKSQAAIADAMQQNNYLQREITAARANYNDYVTKWNTDIFKWPTYKIVASRQKYTTRIPFAASAETKAEATSIFFDEK